MNKQAGFTEGFSSGLAGGLVSAAAVAFAHDVITAIQERKDEERRKHPKTNKDTIVVNLPPKQSSARDSFEDIHDNSSKTINPTGDKSRDIKGQFTPRWVNKTASDWYTRPAVQKIFSALVGAGILSQMPKTQEEASKVLSKSWDRGKTLIGGAAGLALGYTGLRKIHQYVERKRLEQEIAEAQEEYANSLMKPAYDILNLGIGVEKSAAPYTGNSYNPQDSGTALERLDSAGAKGLDTSSWVLGGGLATTVLTALAIAHVTKKFMDSKYGVPDQTNDKIKRKTRVVFRTMTPDGEKTAEVSPSTAIYAFACIKEAMAEESNIEKQAIYVAPGSALSRYGSKAVLNDKGELATPAEIRQMAGRTSNDPINPGSDARAINTARNMQASKNPLADYLANEDNARHVLDFVTNPPEAPHGIIDYAKQIPKAIKELPLAGRLITGLPKSEEEQRRLFGQALIKNPNLINVLNEDKYKGFVDAQADRYLNQYFSPEGSGIGKALSSGWLGSTPFGGWLKQLFSWLFKNTQWGRNAGMRRFISNYTDDPNKVMDAAAVARAKSQPTPMVKKQSAEKTAQIAAIEEFMANQNINHDIRNKDLEAKIDAIADAVVKKTRKDIGAERNSVFGADAAAREFIDKHRSLILKAIRSAQGQQEQ